MCAMLSVVVASAQSDWETKWKLHVTPTVYGGYNCLENAPIVGIAVPITANFIRCELDFGYTSVETSLGNKSFFTYTQSIGAQYGSERVKGYVMFGATTWPRVVHEGAAGYTGKGSVFGVSQVLGKIKGGVDVNLTSKLMLNLDVAYILWNGDGEHLETFDQLALRAGLGWKF